MANDLGNKLMSLSSLWGPHYFAKTGYYTALGAEAAQGLPNAQLFYAWLRGAAKQFGKWVWGNVSVYNRFSFKTCSMVKQVCECSADGTSLSLMRRLMYQQIMYGSKIFGFESLGGCGVRAKTARLFCCATRGHCCDAPPHPPTMVGGRVEHVSNFSHDAVSVVNSVDAEICAHIVQMTSCVY